MNNQLKKALEENIDRFIKTDDISERTKLFTSIANWLKHTVSDVHYSEWVELGNSELNIQIDYLRALLKDLKNQK